MIKAVIFDLDGLLADTEPLWSIAESEVFNQFGLPVNAEMTKLTTGLRIDEVVDFWVQKFGIFSLNKNLIVTTVLERLKVLINNNLIEKKGARKTIHFFASKNIPLAIASSSPKEIIMAVTNKLCITNQFIILQSAENEKSGKPDPAVYLKCIKKLRIPSSSILAFEDSFNGLKAAKEAHLMTIAVPSADDFNKPEFSIADFKIPSLNFFTNEIWFKINQK